MATNAERQRAYRARRKVAEGNGERRLSTWVPTGTLLDLRRLAAHNGVTVRAMLERLVAAEVERLVATLSDETRTEGERAENGSTQP
jgi:hypothetical protein